MGTTKVKPDVAEEKEEKKEYKKKVQKEKPKPAEAGAELRAIVRVAGTDLDGEKELWRAIMEIKGIGHSLTRPILMVAGLDIHKKLGSLNEQEMQRLEQVIKNPSNFGIPNWVLNRRKDPESGKDIHLTESDLDMQRKFDIQKYIDLKSYRGFRHMFGLPVRGQHTRSTFRKGRVVGVLRKSAMPAPTAGAAGRKEKKEAAPAAAQAAKKEEKKEAK
jgi:small subunit ribosomal protein S13